MFRSRAHRQRRRLVSTCNRRSRNRQYLARRGFRVSKSFRRLGSRRPEQRRQALNFRRLVLRGLPCLNRFRNQFVQHSREWPAFFQRRIPNEMFFAHGRRQAPKDFVSHW